ncbi:MAG: septum formation inhibitor Maf [Candidatus Marinimicrobia bacterium]|nr:septum formation inhibitor Maf [Candidatus Neomarinimicrobiota bacterium]
MIDLNNQKFILASSSPRRLKLLQQIGINPEVIHPVVKEAEVKTRNAVDRVVALSQLKANAVADKVDEGIIIGADSAVVIDNKILGKPSNSEEARSMLQALSGKLHKVVTAFCLRNASNGQTVTELEETSVIFRELTEEEIHAYILKEKPFDKAGSYGIQDSGALFVDRIEGCYNNIVGFPLTRFYKTITDPQTFEKLELS